MCGTAQRGGEESALLSALPPGLKSHPCYDCCLNQEQESFFHYYFSSHCLLVSSTARNSCVGLGGRLNLPRLLVIFKGKAPCSITRSIKICLLGHQYSSCIVANFAIFACFSWLLRALGLVYDCVPPHP
jgi:hypothetical protein